MDQELSIEQFYRFCGDKKLMGAHCKDCGNIFVPPRTMCPKCLSFDVEWAHLKGTGKLISYTETHIPGFSFFPEPVPYIVGVVKLDEGPQIAGIIKLNEPSSELHIGIELEIGFDTEPSEYWPHWPRYFFIPLKS